MDMTHTHSSFCGYLCLESAELKTSFLTARFLRAFNMLTCITNSQETQCFQDYAFLERPFCRASHVTRAPQGTFREAGQMAISATCWQSCLYSEGCVQTHLPLACLHNRISWIQGDFIAWPLVTPNGLTLLSHQNVLATASPPYSTSPPPCFFPLSALNFMPDIAVKVFFHKKGLVNNLH